MIAAADVIFIGFNSSRGRVYRVEAERIVRKLEADPALRADPSSVDLSSYSLIKRVSFFDASELINNDYVVESVEGKLYRIEYVVKDNNYPFIIMNTGFAVFFIVSIAVFIYIGNKVIKPFGRMSSMTVDLAKGNLTQPMKEDKNRFFGKFIWGVDMLRENLEDSRTKNLEYQKEKKTLLLSLSHDIKTPLSAIQLYTKALSEGILPRQMRSGVMSMRYTVYRVRISWSLM